MSHKVQKRCCICGAMYTPCAYCGQDNTAFHWRAVACSMKCGAKYLRMVEEARSANIGTEGTDE